MAVALTEYRIETDGKFFRRNGQRVWLRTVTYGPFPPGKPASRTTEFARIRETGFDSIRIFTLPDRALLDDAERAGLTVFAGLNWDHYGDFLKKPVRLSAANVRLDAWLREHATHPALTGIYVGNEISSDLVRWMGPAPVREAIESLIELGRNIAPHLLFAYANYPSTEYLEPANADFSAFNIYLEDRDAFTAYLRRLQNIAGDRPLVVSEFGMDSLRNSLETQAETLGWARQTSHQEETAGFTVFSWSDLWARGTSEVTDWDFGITDRDGNEKPACNTLRKFGSSPSTHNAKFTVIVCTRNGSERITACLRALGRMTGNPFDTIVVDDGSEDGTAAIVAAEFPDIRLISIPPSGLSAARNIGADAATAEILAFTDDDCEPDREWLTRLGKAFQDPDVAAAGGPNLPPPARTPAEAVIRSAPGAPSHVLLDDTSAEHLPGCNIAVRRAVFEIIGGFDPVFRTAGDDVDFCWRLSDAGHRLAFVPGAFVWHWRRPSLRAFLRQQLGYGKAEKFLLTKHPVRFGKNGEARWTGFVYGGGAIRAEDNSVIYHGPMGQAGYQSIVNRMLPLRPIDSAFRNPWTNFLLALVRILQPAARRWARNRRIRFGFTKPAAAESPSPVREFGIAGTDGWSRDHCLSILLHAGWQASGNTDPWDLEKGGTRVLVAAENLGGGLTNCLFRVWGSHAAAIALEHELRAAQSPDESLPN